MSTPSMSKRMRSTSISTVDERTETGLKLAATVRGHQSRFMKSGCSSGHRLACLIATLARSNSAIRSLHFSVSFATWQCRFAARASYARNGCGDDL
jgi:hypothetical protein